MATATATARGTAGAVGIVTSQSAHPKGAHTTADPRDGSHVVTDPQDGVHAVAGAASSATIADPRDGSRTVG